MKPEITFILQGTITSTQGFLAGATYAGIKKKEPDVLDLGILYSATPCVATAVFTTNLVKAAPVILSQRRLKASQATALVVNSGCANASTGEQGMSDAMKMAELAATALGIPAEDVLTASTGVIGKTLPMDLIKTGINQIVCSREGGHALARAIMTTDTNPKEVAVTVKFRDSTFTIGGIAKGAGMIHPNLATMLCFLTTDAAIEADFLKAALKTAVDTSFNMVSIDGDTSTNDMALIMANGQAGNKMITADSELADAFQQGLNTVCIHLAKAIARDGEGATRLIQVTVSGAASLADARLVARTIISSSLVKSAVHGNDPNWGRILAAAGRSGAEMVESKTDLYIGNNCLTRAGKPLPFDTAEVVRLLSSAEVPIHLKLNLGEATATAWGCDLSEEYVTINSQYTT